MGIINEQMSWACLRGYHEKCTNVNKRCPCTCHLKDEDGDALVGAPVPPPSGGLSAEAKVNIKW